MMDSLNDIELERVTGGTSAANIAHIAAEQQQTAVNAKPGNWSHYHGIVSRFSQGQKSF